MGNKTDWRITRNLRFRDQAIQRLETLNSYAIMYGYTHEKIMAERAKISEFLKPTPGWVKAYVDGYYAKIYHDWWKHELIWCHISPSGRYFTNNKDFPDLAKDIKPLYDAGRGTDISTWKHAHFWKNGNPFSEPEYSSAVPVEQRDKDTA